eukprot:TRINITY_DN102557_c0_g1_i1.p3 TRINITY_DN102557_c0_g1~~TRINITY_DN102557_c0_g1_i1.p3  ORF type:complete len:152 (-),score=40.43 TRINITY_DN102557_c0_g1_i1:82-537(-)
MATTTPLEEMSTEQLLSLRRACQEELRSREKEAAKQLGKQHMVKKDTCCVCEAPKATTLWKTKLRANGEMVATGSWCRRCEWASRKLNKRNQADLTDSVKQQIKRKAMEYCEEPRKPPPPRRKTLSTASTSPTLTPPRTTARVADTSVDID